METAKPFPGGSVVKRLPANAGDLGSIPGSERSPGEGKGNPLQYSCLENSMDRGGWQATVLGVAKSPTQRSNKTTATTQPLMLCLVHGKGSVVGSWNIIIPTATVSFFLTISTCQCLPKPFRNPGQRHLSNNQPCGLSLCIHLIGEFRKVSV